MKNSKPSEGNASGECARLIKALSHTVDGFKAVAPHPAFRLELIFASLLIPLALFIGHSGLERAVLIGSVMLVLMVELLNTCVETTIDRISKDIHPLSKLAKDIGSAAVFLSLVNVVVMWLLIIVFP
jgi:diacylglycerol kinase (ATP)